MGLTQIMCQNGVPRARLAMNVDGDDTPFAVQALSRFLISHTLVTRGALTPGAVVVSVANVGQSNDTLSVDDLSLKAQLPACRTRLGAFFAQSFRDSSVLDAFITEQNARYPQYRFFHVFPELVASELFEYAAFPFPMNWAIWLLMATPMARTPEAIAQVVVYVSFRRQVDGVKEEGDRGAELTRRPRSNRIPSNSWVGGLSGPNSTASRWASGRVTLGIARRYGTSSSPWPSDVEWVLTLCY